MFKLSQLLPIAFISIQLAACGAATEDAGTDLPASTAESAEASQASAALGGDACKNVDITVKNSFFYDGRERTMRVLYVQFYSASEGSWYTEGLTDTTITYGNQHTFWNQDLAHGENDLITKWRVGFRYAESDGDWSDAVYQEIDTPNDECHADDNYTLTVN
jgi:hypothetical protein